MKAETRGALAAFIDSVRSQLPVPDGIGFTIADVVSQTGINEQKVETLIKSRLACGGVVCIGKRGRCKVYDVAGAGHPRARRNRRLDVSGK